MHVTVAIGSLVRAHRCLPRFSRVISCIQHAHHELHTAASPSLDTHSLSEALTSVACDGPIVADQRRRCIGCMSLS